MAEDPLFDRYAGTYVWECMFCEISGCADIRGEAKVSLTKHVARQHPAQYQETMGEEPTDDNVRRTIYEMMEGIR